MYDMISAAVERACPQKEVYGCTFFGNRAAVMGHKDACLASYQVTVLAGLFQHFKTGTDAEKTNAAKTLNILLKQHPRMEAQVTADRTRVEDMIAVLRTGSEDAWYQVNLCFDIIASEETNKSIVVSCGVADPLINIVATGSDAVIPNAMLLLSKFVIFNRAHQDLFAAAGAIPHLVRHLHSKSLDVQSNAAGALWNMAGKNRENQVTIAQLGAFPPLIRLVVRRADTINAAGALWNIIAASDPERSIKITDLEVIRCLLNVFRDGDKDTREWIIGCFDTLTSSNPTNTPELVEAGALNAVMEMLNTADRSEMATHQAVAVLARMAKLVPECRNEVISKGALPALLEILRHPEELGTIENALSTKEHAVGAVREICAISPGTLTAFIDGGGVPAMLALLGPTPCSCQEAVIAYLYELCEGHEEARRAVLGCGNGLLKITMAMGDGALPSAAVVKATNTVKVICEHHPEARVQIASIGTVTIALARTRMDDDAVATCCEKLLCLLAECEECRASMRVAGLESTRAIGYKGPGSW